MSRIRRGTQAAGTSMRYHREKLEEAHSFACVLECGGAPPLLDRRRRRERKAVASSAKAAEHRRTPKRCRQSEELKHASVTLVRNVKQIPLRRERQKESPRNKNVHFPHLRDGLLDKHTDLKSVCIQGPVPV